ncbi:hypothetical protein EYF80_036798 [Liparis tanakae]|uniref:Secreted protein n=1 Tax=Liparis tanakae TaxID=230148 RepID=A0A4Z2GI06_9TELE|nr:hypothetical protein EYF80_036798 [Liparis tanakae]
MSQEFLLVGLTWLFAPGDLTGGYGEEERGRCNHWHRPLSGKSVASLWQVCGKSVASLWQVPLGAGTATTQWRVCDESPAAKLKWQNSKQANDSI